VTSRVTRFLDTASPEALFVLSAIAQYLGATIAVLLFDEVAPPTVAWFRVIGASIALLAVSRHAFRGWTRPELGAAAFFGVATALMNMFFYLAIDRTDLGKSVAIEFIGPVAVAAAMTRTGRNAAALGLAAAGVIVLGGVEVSHNLAGLGFLLAASTCWAVYIVVGARVAKLGRGVAGLGVGLAIGAVAIAPFGAPGSGPVWTTPRLLVACLVVGVFSNAIGYGIDQHVLRRIPVRRFAVLLALLPVTAVAIGWIALDQIPAPIDLAGIGLVLTGVVLQEREELAAELRAPDPA
jgi:inner membrane transporter RhtA